ncbi:MAG: KTSC domain-containing protein [Lachnospiraceae bacterium]|nr:KTSC domain-containing protein [Lachnospiraceae bacterium]
MLLFRFGNNVIAAAGYNAQCELMEIEFVNDGQVWQYFDVPEEVWYQFKYNTAPDCFFNNFIKGNYVEKRVLLDVV